MKIRKILLPTDFSDCARLAQERAFRLARLYGAEVHFLHVVVLHDDNLTAPISTFPESEEISRHLTAIAEEELLALRRGAPDITSFSHLRRGLAAAPTILDVANHENIDLIVLGAHGRRGWRRLLLGSVAEEVVRLARCPVLTVRAESPEKLAPVKQTELPSALLAPVDFSNESAAALAAAKELAAEWKAELHVLHVIEKPVAPYYDGAQLSLRGEIDSAAVRLRIEKDLQRFVTETDGPLPLKMRQHVVEGRAADKIAELSGQLGGATIIMATQGLRGIEAFLLGSVTEKVIRLAHGAVLVWRPLPARRGDQEADRAA